MSTIEIEIPACGDIYIIMSRNMCGNVLRASAMYCIGIVERSLWLSRSQTPYLNVAFG